MVGVEDDGILMEIVEKYECQHDSGDSLGAEEVAEGDDYKIKFVEVDGDGLCNEIALDDEDESSFIRIRSQGDCIFEEEDEDQDEEDETFYDFSVPQIEFGSPPSPSRKRKQQHDSLYNELVDIIEMDNGKDVNSKPMDMFTTTEFIPTKRRDRLPLYLLNPDEFPNDPKKQMQIRRAIITYHHHKNKKEQIVSLREENKKLRLHNTALKAKVEELSKCGCEKNKYANLDELNMVIPEVPPITYVRGQRRMLGVPNNETPPALPTTANLPPANVVKSEIGEKSYSVTHTVDTPLTTQNLPPTPTEEEMVQITKPLPLINITSTRLADLRSSALKSNNVVMQTVALPKPPIRKVLSKGTISASLPLTNRTPLAGNLLQTGNGVSAVGQTGLIAPVSIKIEPEEFVPLPFTQKHDLQIDTTVLAKGAVPNPATAKPASRIVFAKKGNLSNFKAKTASQLLFGQKSTAMQPNNCIQTPQFALQLAHSYMHPGLATQFKLDLSSVGPYMNTRLSNKSEQVYTTASGHVLQLVQPTVTRGTRRKLQSKLI